MLQARDGMLNKPEEKGPSFATRIKEKVQPAWTKLKSKLSRVMSVRMHYQCYEVFDKGINKCHQRFQDMKVGCFSLPEMGKFFRLSSSTTNSGMINELY